MAIENNNRIAKNTVMLYIRMLCIMGVSLYTSRVVLQLLGFDDNGIYVLVGGIVAMFSFLTNSMATATQRFLSFEIGRKAEGQLRLVFNTALNIHLILGFAALFLTDVAGVWFIHCKANISPDRLDAALLVFHFSIVSFFFSVIQSPFNALIIAHERMNIYAVMSMVEAGLKLLAVLLLKVCGEDKLVTYGAFMLCVTMIVALIYMVYCHRNYPNCRFRLAWDKGLFLSMFSFIRWNLFGSLAWLLKGHGINLLLNVFFGTIINTARGIAYQVSGSISLFIVNFQTAANPQIIKYYAEGNVGEMMKLVMRSAKFSFFLILFLSVPVLLETDFILRIWLVSFPPYTILFTRLILLDVLFDSISGPMMTSAQATGRIRLYQLLVGTILLLNIPVSYLFLKSGFPPEVTMYVSIGLTLVAIAARMWIIHYLLDYPIRHFGRLLYGYIGKVVLIAPLLPVLLYGVLAPGWVRFLIVGGVSVVSVVLTVYVLGLDKAERLFIREKLTRFITK